MVLGLRYRDCRFLLNANCGVKNLESGTKREGRSGFWNQDFFFLALCNTTIITTRFVFKFKDQVHKFTDYLYLYGQSLKEMKS